MAPKRVTGTSVTKKANIKATVTANAQSKRLVSLEERLKRLFTSLCTQIDDGHFINAIKTCNKILFVNPEDKDALQTRLFLLLQTEQYDKALSIIGNVNNEKSNCNFEKAYALYRLHNEAEAAAVLAQIKDSQRDHRGVLHLEAQLNYRQGLYQSSLDLYNELLETADPQSEEYSDVLTNLAASQKHLDFITTGFLHALDVLPPSFISTIETVPPPTSHTSQILLESHAAQNIQSTEEATTGQVKKVRMKRVPKGVIPGVTPPPDPERWLKKSERTNYALGKKRKGAGGGATQGIVTENVPPQTHVGKAGGTSHSKGKKKKL